MRRVCAKLLITAAIGLGGCAQWAPDSDNDGRNVLPPPQKSLDSVLIESVLVRFPTSQLDDLEPIWWSVDESQVNLETRKLLDKNGLRAGLLIGEIPKVIRDQIELTSEKQSRDALEHAGLAADVDNKMRQLQCRAGRRKDLVVRRELHEPLTVLTTLDGETVSGDTYFDPTVLFELKALPHGDGRATIELTPEIQHGQHRQSYVSTEFGVRPELKRAQQTWRDLSIKLKMKPGEVLVLAGTRPAKALGRAFFITRTADQSEEHVVLLLRLAGTRLDELFAPDEVEQASAMAERF